MLSMLTISCSGDDSNQQQLNTDSFSNEISDDRMTLILAAPSVHDPTYSDYFSTIVNFQVQYANAVIGNDNVIIIVDEDTKIHYTDRVPEDILITQDIYDIWMRDFTTVNPENPVQFKYTAASMTPAQSISVQNSFINFSNAMNIQKSTSNLIIDGGNIVDNYHGRAVTTTRFLEDNNFTMNQGKTALKNLLNANEIAIIEPDDLTLAHSDGMVMWLDENTLLVNDYSNDTTFRNMVLGELYSSFPGVNIIEIPVVFSNGGIGNISSSCGININSVLTYNNVYVPVFDMAHDTEALQIIRNNTTKNVIPVSASGVCTLGGSVRCLTWQLTGNNAKKLILAGRNL